MIQQVKYDDLVEEEKYFVIHKREAYVLGNLIYHGNHYFKYPNSKAIFQIVDMFHFYRYVTKNEYYMKVKEKYDQTSLDIVLKRLVNENFQW